VIIGQISTAQIYLQTPKIITEEGRMPENQAEENPKKKRKIYHFRCAGCEEEFEVSNNPQPIDPERIKYCPYCGSYADLVYISK